MAGNQQCSLSPSGFPTKTVYIFATSSMNSLTPAHRPWFYHSKISGEKYKFELPYYVIFSNILSLPFSLSHSPPLSQEQMFFSVPSFQTRYIYFPLEGQVSNPFKTTGTEKESGDV